MEVKNFNADNYVFNEKVKAYYALIFKIAVGLLSVCNF